MISRNVAALAQALAAKEISSVELTQLYLDRIAHHNPTLNAFITVDAEKSLASGMDGHLTKPVSLEALHDALLKYKKN